MADLESLLAARGLLNPVKVVDQAANRLQRLPPEARAAFAALCAQRLLNEHLRLPDSEQLPFTLSWVPVIQTIWFGVSDPGNLSTKAVVEGHLKAFYDGPFNCDLGEDAPAGADDDAAAGSIFAAQAFCQGDVQSAKWAAGRLIDAADKLVRKARAGLPEDIVEELAHPMSQGEARRLMRALDFLESQPWSVKLIPKLRSCFDQETI